MATIAVRIEELKKQKASMPEFCYATRKENILVRMKKLVPGTTCTSIGGMWDYVAHQVATEASDIANILSKYWQNVRFEFLQCSLRLVWQIGPHRKIRTVMVSHVFLGRLLCRPRHISLNI